MNKKILGREKAKIDDLLTIPIADRPNWSVNEINLRYQILLKQF